MILTNEEINRLVKLGMTATDQTYGNLSPNTILAPLNNMGTDIIQPYTTPEGFIVTKVLNDPSTGFRLAFYKNEQTHEILVVPNGSDGWNAQDWASNGLYTGANQWKDNQTKVLDVVREMIKADSSATINIVGHSLGGAEAQYCLASLLVERQKPTIMVKNTGEAKGSGLNF